MTARVLRKDAYLASIPGALPRTERRRRAKPTKAKTPEQQTQEMAEQYCRWRGVPPFHIPAFVLANAFRYRDMEGAEKGAAARASDEIRGWPDLTLCFKGHTAYVELKTEIGKMTKAQRDWQMVLGTIQIRSIEAFKAFLDTWIGLILDIEREPGDGKRWLVLREFMHRKSYP
jgi:hypothetical protein